MSDFDQHFACFRRNRLYYELAVANDEIHAGLFYASPLVQDLLRVIGNMRPDWTTAFSIS